MKFMRTKLSVLPMTTLMTKQQCQGNPFVDVCDLDTVYYLFECFIYILVYVR